MSCIISNTLCAEFCFNKGVVIFAYKVANKLALFFIAMFYPNEKSKLSSKARPVSITGNPVTIVLLFTLK